MFAAAVATAPGLAACADDSASGDDVSLAWSAWTIEGETLSVSVDEGLLAGRSAEAVTKRPSETRDGHAIEVGADGSLTYTSPVDFWGATSFEYEIGGRAHIGYITVAPVERAMEWSSASNRQLVTGWGAGDGFGASIVSAGDMDGDGDDELVVSAPRANASIGPDRDEGAVVIIPGRGDGTFSQGGNWLYGPHASMQLGVRICAPGDQDGDGLADVWVMGYGDPNVGLPSVHLLTGRDELTAFAGAAFEDVAGRALTELPFPTFDTPAPVVCGLDLVGDDAPDLVFADSQSLWVVDGHTAGQRTFDEARIAGDATQLTGNWPEVALDDGRILGIQRVPDLDGDDLDDLAVSVRVFDRVAGSRVDLLGSATQTTRTLVSAQHSVGSVAVADFDGDGSHDVAIANRDHVSVFFDVDTETEGPLAEATIELSLEGASPLLQTADVDGDGTEDLIIALPYAQGAMNQPHGRGAIAVLRGGPTFMRTLVSTDELVDGTTGFVLYGADAYRGFGNAGVAFGDFDGDAVPDLVVSAPGHATVPPGGGDLPAGEVGAAMIIRGFGPPRI